MPVPTMEPRPISTAPGTPSTRASFRSGPTPVVALTAASVACLTIYDMAKAVDRGMVISNVRLLEKSGGKSGDYKATD